MNNKNNYWNPVKEVLCKCWNEAKNTFNNHEEREEFSIPCDNWRLWEKWRDGEDTKVHIIHDPYENKHNNCHNKESKKGCVTTASLDEQLERPACVSSSRNNVESNKNITDESDAIKIPSCESSLCTVADSLDNCTNDTVYCGSWP